MSKTAPEQLTRLLGLENVQQTRREFLTRLGRGAGRVVVKNVEPLIPSPEHSENEAIVYTGPKEIEIDGKKYEVEVNGEAFVGLAYEMARRSGDSDLLRNLHAYFKTNHVNLNIYDLASNPVPSLMLAGGYYRAPFLNFLGNGDSEIGISAEVAAHLYRMAKSGDRDAKLLGGLGISPLVVFPHEMEHFNEFVRSPIEYSINQLVDTLEFAIAYVGGWRAFRFFQKKLPTKLAAFGGLTTWNVINTFQKEVANRLLGIGTHGKIDDSDQLEIAVKNNHAILNLTLDVFKFTPIETK